MNMNMNIQSFDQCSANENCRVSVFSRSCTAATRPVEHQRELHHKNNPTTITAMTNALKVTPLQCAYTFSFMRRGKGTTADAAGTKKEEAGAEPNPYENAIKTITTVSSVEEFWAVYDYLKRPSDLTPTTDYQ
jgi:hypothetical protein